MVVALGSQGMTYTAASIGCWLSFVAFRMVLYPTWLLAFAWDLVHHPTVRPTAETLHSPPTLAISFLRKVFDSS